MGSNVCAMTCTNILKTQYFSVKFPKDVNINVKAKNIFNSSIYVVGYWLLLRANVSETNINERKWKKNNVMFSCEVYK